MSESSAPTAARQLPPRKENEKSRDSAMGSSAVGVSVNEAKLPAGTSARRSSHQSTASTIMTEPTSATASLVTVSPSSARGQPLDGPGSNQAFAYGSSLPPSLASPWLHTPSANASGSRPSEPSLDVDIAGSAPASSSVMMPRNSKLSSEDLAHSTRSSIAELESIDDTMNPPMSATAASTAVRDSQARARNAVGSRSNQSGRNIASGTNLMRGPMASSSSAVDRRLIEKYERVNTEIERVIRSTNAELNSENGELLRQVRSELRKTKRNSTQIIQSQKELLEKMERQERSGFRRMFSLNREHKMEKIRHKLCEKLSQSVAVEQQLDRLERQSVSLTRMSFGSMCNPNTGMEYDELSDLEREREDILNNLISSAGLTDAQELHQRLALYSSEKRACECSMKQVDQCETLYRKALHLLRIALSTILAPTYSGGLKEFVLGPYPLAVEASQLIEQSCRVIQPESRRRYKSYTPELSNVRPPKFPQPMIDFAKRGTRSNFDPSNSAAIEAMRKLRTSENVVILLQRIVIAKLELIEKWRRDVERDQEVADDGYRKVDARLQEQVARLARTVTTA